MDVRGRALEKSAVLAEKTSKSGGGKGWLRSDVERWLIAGGSGDPL
jgi:hypothetical protein